MIINRGGYTYDDTDLNSMLQYCAHLRGTLNTMHRTRRVYKINRKLSDLYFGCFNLDLNMQEILSNYWEARPDDHVFGGHNENTPN